jgi:hypothetical protein
MTKIQDIVPMNIKPNQVVRNETTQSHSTKPKIDLRLKREDLDITFYNGCDKYLLYNVLKEPNNYNH